MLGGNLLSVKVIILVKMYEFLHYSRHCSELTRAGHCVPWLGLSIDR